MREEPEIVDAELVGEPKPHELEPGGLPSRFGALCLDLFLLVAVFGLLVTQVILPQWHPGAMEEFLELIQQHENAEEGAPPPTPSPALEEAADTVNMIFFLMVYFYFTFVPHFLGGGTLGMRIFNLRIQNMNTPTPAPLRAHLIRGAIKTVCLQIFFPLLTLLFLVALRTPQRIALHDMLARTRVVRAPAFSSK